MQRVPVTKKDLARGLDQFSARGSIPDGFVEDSVNWDTNANGKLSTRSGYEGYYGWVPLRATRVDHDGTDIRFQLDRAVTVTFETARRGPIIVYGRTSAAHAGDFSTAPTGHYYTEFELIDREVLGAGTGTLTKTADSHGMPTQYMAVGFARSTSTADSSNVALVSDETRIDTANLDVAIDYDTPAVETVFVYFRDLTPESGVVQLHTFTGATSTSVAVTDVAAEGLLVLAFDTGTADTAVPVWPDLLYLQSSGGTTTCYANFSTATGGYLLLCAVPANQRALANIAGAGTHTLTFQTDNAFCYFGIYRQGTGGQRELIVPDLVSYDGDTGQHTIRLVTTGAESLEVVWLTGITLSNTLSVTDTTATSESWTDLTPQLTIWGIPHSTIYRTEGRGGHVTWIDTYRSVGEGRIVCGLGGNVFAPEPYAQDSEYLIPQRVLRLRETASDTDQLLAPLFWTTDPGAVRDRGVVYDASVVAHAALVTAATYVSDGVVDYTLTFVAKTGTISFDSTVDGADQLTVSGLANPEHSGAWPITDVVDSGNTVTVRCQNPNIHNATRDETGARGRAAVLTDRFLGTAGACLPGDVLVRAAEELHVVGVSELSVYLELDDATTISAGAIYDIRRTTAVFPLLAGIGGLADVTNVVRGDMLVLEGLERRLRVVNVITAASQPVAFTSADGTTTVSGFAADPRVRIGDRVVLTAPSGTDVAGEFVVALVNDDGTFAVSVDTTFTAGSGTLIGQCVEVDEVLEVESTLAGTELYVEGRWVPVEAPATTYDLPASTHTRYFDRYDYTDQRVIRSAPISDSLYLVNGAVGDEVYKYDGANLYRAGLPRWQGGLFAAIDTSAPVQLATGAAVEYSARSVSGHYFTVDAPMAATGDRLYSAEADATYLVTEVVVKDTNESRLVISAEQDLTDTAASGTLTKVRRFKYMVRWSAVDANDSVVVSAECNSEDLVIDYVGGGAVNLRVVGLPDFGAYDYERIQLEVFRTKANGALYYLIERRPVDFSQRGGYIDIVDATEDAFLTETDTIAQAVGLGPEVGTTWSDPPRAAQATSVAGRLVLSSLASYPELTLDLQPIVGEATLTSEALDGVRFLLRRDPDDSATGTSVVDRIAYEFVTTSQAVEGFAIQAFGSLLEVYLTAHGRAAGDWVYLFHSTAGTNKSLAYAGWHQIVSTSPDTFTVRGVDWPAPGDNEVDSVAWATDPRDVPVYVGASGVDGNYYQVGGSTASDSLFAVAGWRLANAVNASMRRADRSLEDQADFRPWLAAAGGNDFANGRCVLTSPLAAAELPELVVYAQSVRVYANDFLRSDGDVTSFVVRRLGSYLARSYTNYPELFDGLGDDSDSLIPINPADGQDVVISVPFFGESTTGENLRLNQEVAVFKENSIYLVNVDTRQVQRINSRGVGCSAADSVVVTRDGIMFAHTSGVYMLTRDMRVVEVGRNLRRYWDSSVQASKDYLANATAHHDVRGRRYKLAIPTDGEQYPDRVLVYDYEREGQGQDFGAWARYANFPTVGYCNFGDNSYWASQAGDVYMTRRRGEASDFRDDAAAISSVLTLRAEDFDLPDVRKSTRSVATVVELERTDVTGLAIQIAQDLSDTFESAGAVRINRATERHLVFNATPASKRGSYIQVRYEHATKDEQVVLAAVAYYVGQVSPNLIKEVADLAG